MEALLIAFLNRIAAEGSLALMISWMIIVIQFYVIYKVYNNAREDRGMCRKDRNAMESRMIDAMTKNTKALGEMRGTCSCIYRAAQKSEKKSK